MLSNGLRYKPVVLSGKVPKLPDSFPSDADLYEFRCSQVCRIFGYKVNSVFYIVWFDPRHQVFPG